ncbi:hypothetical protein [Aeromicrobium sp. Root472D3]|uniref:hypothetical protein n=1 Tax=Aeromicrobium sp. Root472D3 TaxID=1736540 RepID=UPI0006F5F8F8|nr:hypothetical protein [Aeromicrobium sp. Root472D3]KQX74487.1 hypothetical protein ASD10_04425 [Aeromicrobium sp. Root472D3]
MDVARDLVVPWGAALQPGTLERCFSAPHRDDVAFIDLAHVTWVQPYGLTSLAVFAESQLRMGRDVVLERPKDDSVANYLSRMGLGGVISDIGGRHDLPSVARYPSDELVELQRFVSPDQSDTLGQMVYNKIVDSDEGMADALNQSIAEMGQNVPEHSGVVNGYFAAQTTYRRKQVSFSIGDSGVGLTASLAGAGLTFADDAATLEAVMKGGVTRTGEDGRGKGFVTARDKIVGMSGTFFYQSGEAARFEQQTRPVTKRSDPDRAFPGTVLQGRFNC